MIGALAAVAPGKPSVSALEVTAYRAIGARHRDAAIRNADTLAESFLGPEERAILKKAGSDIVLKVLEMDTESGWASLGARRGFAQAVHARTRHIDSVFAESVRSGANQVVILGAGLDSRAYRFDKLLAGGRVFEVDFPPTQEYKKKRVREIRGSLPAHVRYAPIDFTKDDLKTVLKAAGYDRTKKTTFVWEGVTFYIPEEAVDTTLRFVANHSAPGSTIVFDYFVASTLKAPPAPLKDVMNRLEAVREPLIFGLPDDDRQGFITRRGLEDRVGRAHGRASKALFARTRIAGGAAARQGGRLHLYCSRPLTARLWQPSTHLACSLCNGTIGSTGHRTKGGNDARGA